MPTVPRSLPPQTLAAALLVALALAPGAAADPPKRIVALTPFSANTLVDLGVKPIAVGDTPGGHERFSRKLRGVDTLPLSHPNGPNMEQLAVLNPQLVFSSPTWRKGAQTMRDLDIDVVESDPRSIRDVTAQTRRIGRIVGRASKGKRLAERLTERIAKARKGIRKHPRVMLVLGVGRTPFVFLPNSWGGDLLRKAGARLVTGGVSHRSGFVRISDEKVVTANPDVIVAVPHANQDDIPDVIEYLRSNPAWEDTSAVRKHRLYVSTDDSLLQAGTDVARVIRSVRDRYLRN